LALRPLKDISIRLLAEMMEMMKMEVAELEVRIEAFVDAQLDTAQ
jgi:hypothetical protein